MAKGAKGRQQADNLFQEAVSCQQKKMVVQAEALYMKLLRLYPGHVAGYNNLGSLYLDSGRSRKAEECFRKTLRLAENHVPALYNLGTLCVSLGKDQEGIAYLAKAFSLEPENVRCAMALGNTCKKLRDWDRAEQWLKRVMEIDANFSAAYSAMAELCYLTQRYEEACNWLEGYLEKEPDAGMGFLQLARVRHLSGQFDMALAAAQKAALLLGEAAGVVYHEASIIQALVLLRQGQWEEGFQLFESRLMLAEAEMKSWKEGFLSGVCRWDGQDLLGKRLVVLSEQGIGDIVQFVRYLPLLKEQGCWVALSVTESLGCLLQKVEGVDEVIPCDKKLLNSSFDYYVPLLSLPYIFKTTTASVPPPIRLAFPNRANEKSSRLSVGLAWYTDEENREMLPVGMHRSCEWEAVESITRMKEIDVQLLPPIQEEEDGKAVGFFAVDIAAVTAMEAVERICHLDLVIAVDSATAHLAAAMNKTVWILLPFYSEWRWGDGKVSPWYPEMKIFRQRLPGDWNGVVRRVIVALRQWRKQKFIASAQETHKGRSCYEDIVSAQ